jgi:hypothetical protein
MKHSWSLATQLPDQLRYTHSGLVPFDTWDWSEGDTQILRFFKQRVKPRLWMMKQNGMPPGSIKESKYVQQRLFIASKFSALHEMNHCSNHD